MEFIFEVPKPYAVLLTGTSRNILSLPPCIMHYLL